MLIQFNAQKLQGKASKILILDFLGARLLT